MGHVLQLVTFVSATATATKVGAMLRAVVAPCRIQPLNFLAWAVYEILWPLSLVCLTRLRELLGRMHLTICQIYQRANVRTRFIQICAGFRLNDTLSEVYNRRLSFC